MDLKTAVVIMEQAQKIRADILMSDDITLNPDDAGDQALGDMVALSAAQAYLKDTRQIPADCGDLIDYFSDVVASAPG